MKALLSAIVVLSASFAMANSPAKTGHKKEMATKTTTVETTKETAAVDCTMKENMKKPECQNQKPAGHHE